MKFIYTILFLSSFLSANIADIPKEYEIKGHFASNKECVRCHLDIYMEFKDSKHQNSNILNNSFHKAMYSKNPLSKKERYICASCHAPTAKNIDKVMAGKAKMSKKNRQDTEGISCAYCHRIKSIAKHGKKHKNIINDKKLVYYGKRKQTLDSPFHDVNSSNKQFNRGDICLGCHTQHSRQKNLVAKKGQIYCVYSKLDENESRNPNTDKQNCITCHMPQVEGSLSDRLDTTTHAYHGFSGIGENITMLDKYVDINITKSDKGFEVAVTNNSSHNLLLHPTRGLFLKVHIEKDEKIVKTFETIKFQKEAIVSKAKPLSWLKDRVDYKNSIKSKQTKRIDYKYIVASDEEIVVQLLYQRYKDDIAKKTRQKKAQYILFKEKRR